MEPKHEGNGFRYFLGVICIIGGLILVGGLFFVEVPAGNKEPLLLAIGLVLGWGSAVVQSEYGATTTGRKVADAAVRNIEQQTVSNADANERAALGTEAKPVPVETRTEAAKEEEEDAAPR
jgi:hypothetical protein